MSRGEGDQDELIFDLIRVHYQYCVIDLNVILDIIIIKRNIVLK